MTPSGRRRDLLGGQVPARRRLSLYFGVRLVTPALALIALAAMPTGPIDDRRIGALLTAQVATAALAFLLATRRRATLSLAIWTGILANLALVTLLVAATGGPGGPLAFLYTLEAVSAGILISSVAGMRVLLLSAGSMLVLDLARGEGIIGSASDPSRAFPAIIALGILGGGATLFSAFNERELKRRNAELAMIGQIALDIENTLALDTILEHLTRGVVERFGFDAAAVLTRRGEQLACVGAAGITGAVGLDVQARGPLCEALGSGRPRVVPTAEARADGALADLLGARGYVAIPLAGEGLLVVSRSGRGKRPGLVRGHEVDALVRLAHHAALATANARMHAHVSALAVTDPLTGLLNHGEMHRRLAHELGRLARYATPKAPGHRLSLVLLDVDHFKRFNDRFGHLAGDSVLKEVAEALRQGVRSFDVVARYGGDEFAVMLPETTPEGALTVAGRIQKALAEHPFQSGERGALPITVSMGIATAPENGLNPAALIAAADAAMYRSKESGRGRATHAADRPRLAKVVALRRPATRRRPGPDEDRSRGASQRARAPSSRPRRRTPPE